VLSNPKPSNGDIADGRCEAGEKPLMVEVAGDDGRELTERFDSRSGESGCGGSPVPYEPSCAQVREGDS